MAELSRREQLNLEREIKESLDSQLNTLNDVANAKAQLREANRRLADEERILLDLQKDYNKATGNAKKTLEDEIKLQEKFIKQAEFELALLRKNVSVRKVILKQAKELANEGHKKSLEFVKDTAGFLLDIQKTSKQVSRNIGLSSKQSQLLDKNIASSANFMAEMMMSAEDAYKAQEQFSRETGRATILTEKQFKNIALVQRSTGLSLENVTNLTAAFTKSGRATNDLKKLVNQTVKSSKNLGLNSQVVLEKFTELAKQGKLITLFFADGAKGLARMVQTAQRLQIDTSSIEAAAETFRTLEGTIEATAKLSTLGGGFNNADPLGLSFLARTDPAKLGEEIGKMGANLFKFNKETNQFEAGAYGLDILREAAQATNVPFEELVQSAQATAKISAAKGLIRVGSKEDRELLASLAQLNEDGKFTIDGQDIRTITQGQIKGIRDSQESLEKAAKDATSFNELQTQLTMKLQSAALPLLQNINSLLDGVLKFTSKIDGKTATIIAGGIGAVAAGGVLMKGGSMLGKIGGGIGGLGKGAGGAIGGLGKGAGGAIGGLGRGIGGGIGGALTGVASGLGSLANPATIIGLGAITLAIMGIGKAIEFASNGIAKMVQSFQSLTDANIGPNVVQIGSGLLKISGAATVLGNPLAVAGLISMNKFLDSVINQDFDPLSNALYNANQFMQADTTNLDNLVKVVEAINQSENTQQVLAEMRDLLKGGQQGAGNSDQPMRIMIESKIMLDKNTLVAKTAEEIMIKVGEIEKGRSSSL